MPTSRNHRMAASSHAI